MIFLNLLEVELSTLYKPVSVDTWIDKNIIIICTKLCASFKEYSLPPLLLFCLFLFYIYMFFLWQHEICTVQPVRHRKCL